MTLKEKKYRGVSFHKGRGHGGYRAKITFECRDIFLGEYPTPEGAAEARDIAEKLLRGPDAVLNFNENRVDFITKIYVIKALAKHGIKVTP